ncbi:MAG: peptidoglycan DD-metalloendopeptidase family protein [Acidobacteriota bacterium]|jgi:murein DD-endopeptidase MepM/ murein hydrolase activator NlpD|nr:peptidoglycan DD-metalloendopeptidase family protein [Acidobacteriota bacterium]
MNETAINFLKPNIPDIPDMAQRVSFSDKDKAELKKAAQEFEAVFIGQLLKVMRETIEESDPEGGGFGKTIYTELFDQEVARGMAQRGALGIGDIIYKSLVDKENAGAVRLAPPVTPHSDKHEAAPAAPSIEIPDEAPVETEDSVAPQEITNMLLPVHAPISSAFGMRKDPFTGKPRFHKGVDIAAPAGTPVLAALPGKVISAGREGGYGNTVLVEHGDGLRTRYGHLSSIDVKVGDTVTSGGNLGTVGSTGRSTGPHLHFEVIRMGKPANPLASLR